MLAPTTTTIPTRVGQHGRLRLGFRAREGRSVLAGRYSSAPFGPVWATYPGGAAIPEVQITNPSGGILGGDRLEMEVEVEPGSSAALLTQGASRVYKGVQASQHAVLRLGEGAFLEYLPHHLIPYAGSHYRQRTEFYLSEEATLLAWEAFAAGRVGRGERFLFDHLSTRTHIFRGGVPEMADGFELSCGGEPFSGYSYLGALYLQVPEKDLRPVAEELHGMLEATSHTLASASSPTPPLCTVRILAQEAPALYKTLNQTRAHLREHLNLPLPSREIW